MSIPTSSFNFNELMQNVLDSEDMLEGRFENNAENNPIYVGYTPVPNADPALPLWFIMKIDYDGTGIIRKRLPNAIPPRIGFTYVWEDRDTYFT